MRIPFVAANWKMHKDRARGPGVRDHVREQVGESPGFEIVIAPPFTALHAVAAALVDTSVGIAGQDLHWEPAGAFTGEVSAAMLREAGAAYVIIGHSERRQLFGETDENVNTKIRAAIASGLTPILCVGETLATGNRTRPTSFWIDSSHEGSRTCPHRMRRRWSSRTNQSGRSAQVKTRRRPRRRKHTPTFASSLPKPSAMTWQRPRG